MNPNLFSFLGLRCTVQRRNGSSGAELSSEASTSGEILYHYTSVESLLQIVQSNCLWASDLNAVNDPAELIHVREVAMNICFGQMCSHYLPGVKVFQDFVNKAPIPPQLHEREENYKHFVSGVHELMDKRALEGWKMVVGRVFGVSFCAAGDLLSQWRGYGLDEYSPYSQTELIQRSLTREFEEYCRQIEGVALIFSISKTGPQDIALRASTEAILRDLFSVAHSFKKSEFSEEREYRLVRRLPWAGEEIGTAVQLRAKGNKFIPYVVFSPTPGKLPITEVIRGPAHIADVDDYALKALLKRSGHLNVEVTGSKYALR